MIFSEYSKRELYKFIRQYNFNNVKFIRKKLIGISSALLLVTKKFAVKCKLSRNLITQTFWNPPEDGQALTTAEHRELNDFISNCTH